MDWPSRLRQRAEIFIKVLGMHLDIDVVGGREEYADQQKQESNFPTNAARMKPITGEPMAKRTYLGENGRTNFYLTIPDVLIYRHTTITE